MCVEKATSGYVSNDAAIGTIGRLLSNCLILSDEKNHASMIAGIRTSGAEKRIFRHNAVGQLEQVLQAAERNRLKVLAFESLYSMDGDIAPAASAIWQKNMARSPIWMRSTPLISMPLAAPYCRTGRGSWTASTSSSGHCQGVWRRRRPISQPMR
jgi:Aminotransferase class I and II